MARFRTPRFGASRLVAMTIAAGLFVTACGGGSGDSFCDQAQAFGEADLSGDPETLERRLEDALVTLDRLVDSAPDAIVSDVITVRDGVEEFARGTGLLGPTFAEASERVADYVDTECPTP